MKTYTDWMEQRLGGRRSLRWSMVRRLLFGWFFPLFMLICIIIFFVSSHNYQQVRNTIMTSLEKSTQMMRMELKNCEIASKNASYISVIAKSYADYLKDEDQSTFRLDVENFLKQQYQYDDNFRTAELIVLNEPEERYFAINNSSGGTYRDIEFFYETAKDELLMAARNLDTGTTLKGIDGRVYMVRNLINSKFVPYAVLALELNQHSLMESYAGIWGYEKAAVYWNGRFLMGEMDDGGEELPEEIAGLMGEQEEAYVQGGRWESIHAYRKMNLYGGTMVAAAVIDKRTTHAEMRTLEYLFVLLVIFMIPLVVQMLRFFHKKVTLPIQQLVTAANKVREGELGIQIENEEDNEEFYQMKDSFNHMSSRLKSQFDRIYLEEIALRDARIMALQSQINPHFLNNTLEIINWEARLTGNYKVSGMIEALSTMLGETMNRKEQQFHSIAEEMAYADAYLYIIRQRFGTKFQCVRHIDESLYDVQIPRLIIQPVVENAVEHGMDFKGQGRMEIRLCECEGGYLRIEVEDSGYLTKEAREKIARLLSPDAEPSGEKSVSLGIRNVNQRLKMIYGDDCGLFVKGNEKEHTVMTILLKTHVQEEQY